VTHAPGAGRYARELVRALVRLDERPEIALYEVGRAERTVEERALGLPANDPGVSRLVSNRSRRVSGWIPMARLACADAALGGVDVFHHTSRVLPRVKSALQTVAVAEVPYAGSIDENRLARSLSLADAVLVFSTGTGKRLAQRFQVPPERIRQVVVGCEHWRRDLGRIPPRDEVPRVLVLGPLRKDRRHRRILKAFEHLIERGRNAHLHVVGTGGDAEAEFDDLAAHSKVKLRISRERAASQVAVAALVARASVLIHLVEGSETPVTPLEAFSMGTPVVASGLPAYEEALGGLAELVENARVDHASEFLADAIERAIASAGDAAACAARERLASAFTWERNARETVAAWESIFTSSRR
jgi:glycosyltransferase involved in cell wall biosynthesis